MRGTTKEKSKCRYMSVSEVKGRVMRRVEKRQERDRATEGKKSSSVPWRQRSKGHGSRIETRWQHVAEERT